MQKENKCYDHVTKAFQENLLAHEACFYIYNILLVLGFAPMLSI